VDKIIDSLRTLAPKLDPTNPLERLLKEGLQEAEEVLPDTEVEGHEDEGDSDEVEEESRAARRKRAALASRRRMRSLAETDRAVPAWEPQKALTRPPARQRSC
jgi:hypothetical protein